jgi:hypothetical protein
MATRAGPAADPVPLPRAAAWTGLAVLAVLLLVLAMHLLWALLSALATYSLSRALMRRLHRGCRMPRPPWVIVTLTLLAAVAEAASPRCTRPGCPAAPARDAGRHAGQVAGCRNGSPRASRRRPRTFASVAAQPHQLRLGVLRTAAAGLHPACWPRTNGIRPGVDLGAPRAGGAGPPGRGLRRHRVGAVAHLGGQHAVHGHLPAGGVAAGGLPHAPGGVAGRVHVRRFIPVVGNLASNGAS